MKQKMIGILITCGIIAIIFTARVPCLFKTVTGFECPGCGNIRAVKDLLQGNVRALYEYNAMFIPEVLYMIYVSIFHIMRRFLHMTSKIFKIPWIDIVMITAIAGWWVIRNVI